MKPSLGRLFVAALLGLQASVLPVSSAGAEEAAPVERRGEVAIAKIDGSINPASSTYLQRAIEEAEQRDAAILLIELDTPGGLVSSTQDIIQAMLASKVPIVVYVAPQGAWAGSAGTFITLAAHVAAMAPGTSIGAAHPVELGGGAPAPAEGEEKPAATHAERKAENLLVAFIESIAEKRDRNVEWAEKAVRESVAVGAEEALELNVIDLVARDRAALLEALDGREVQTDEGPVVLVLAGASQYEIEMGAVLRVFSAIADPNVVWLLFMAGLALLYLEFNQPGMIVPGVLGAGCLVLALIAIQALPFSWMGVMLVLLGAGLLV
ncbi:MAG: ATP-dependent Clp protease proteolytic subunit, partial [Myxococcota bacterium]